MRLRAKAPSIIQEINYDKEMNTLLLGIPLFLVLGGILVALGGVLTVFGVVVGALSLVCVVLMVQRHRSIHRMFSGEIIVPGQVLPQNTWERILNSWYFTRRRKLFALSYAYSYQGKTYKGEFVTDWKGWGKYKDWTPIRVLVDPQKPATSVVVEEYIR